MVHNHKVCEILDVSTGATSEDLVIALLHGVIIVNHITKYDMSVVVVDTLSEGSYVQQQRPPFQPCYFHPYTLWIVQLLFHQDLINGCFWCSYPPVYHIIGGILIVDSKANDLSSWSGASPKQLRLGATIHQHLVDLGF